MSMIKSRSTSKAQRFFWNADERGLRQRIEALLSPALSFQAEERERPHRERVSIKVALLRSAGRERTSVDEQGQARIKMGESHGHGLNETPCNERYVWD